MQVLFCHDGPLRVDKDSNYYGIAHNNHLFKRYYKIADSVAVAIRLKNIKNKEEKELLSQITVSPFKLYEISNPSSIKGLINRNKINQKIEKAVLDSDYIVARIPSMIGNIAIKHAKKHDKPCLTELVACPWDAFWNHSLKGKLVAPYMYLKTKNNVRNSKYVIYVTNEFLQRRYPTLGVHTNCSNVVLTDLDERILKSRLNKIKSKSSSDKIILGTTAAVNVKYKGQQYIIEALGNLKKSGYINYEYQLVGDGDQSYLRSIAKKHNVLDQIKFLGPKKHEDVFKWLDTIDIYVQPSRQEGLPRALIEAMSRGLPAFGAATAGIPELLKAEYIFSNNKSNIREIITILKQFNKTQLSELSIENYKEAYKYHIDLITKKRDTFFEQFKEENDY